MESAIIQWIGNQAVGVVAAAVLFYLYDKRGKEHKEEIILLKAEHEATILKLTNDYKEKYESISINRRGDTEKLNDFMNKINHHLARSDAFEELSKRFLQESFSRELPKRRATDNLIRDALNRLDLTDSD